MQGLPKMEKNVRMVPMNGVKYINLVKNYQVIVKCAVKYTKIVYVFLNTKSKRKILYFSKIWKMWKNIAFSAEPWIKTSWFT